MNVEVFDIRTKRDDQVKWYNEMTPNERLLLCLDLMDLNLALSPHKKLESHNDDSIEWLELKFTNAESDS